MRGRVAEAPRVSKDTGRGAGCFAPGQALDDGESSQAPEARFREARTQAWADTHVNLLRGPRSLPRTQARLA